MLDVRVGTGAAILPSVANASKEFPAVTRLHLTYAQKIYGGHQGARHFWRNCLPRLKYYNPSIPMTVQQTTEQDTPAALSIYFADRVASTATAIAGSKQLIDKHAPAPQNGEKMTTVNLKDLSYQEIWNRVQASTGANEVPATEEDKAEAKKYAAIDQKAIHDRERIRERRQAKKDQERMLAEARGEVEKLKTS